MKHLITELKEIEQHLILHIKENYFETYYICPDFYRRSKGKGEVNHEVIDTLREYGEKNIEGFNGWTTGIQPFLYKETSTPEYNQAKLTHIQSLIRVLEKE